MDISNGKCVYVCGPLTDLPPEQQIAVKRFYQRIADLCYAIFGERAFVPHEHYDPVKHARFTPRQVDAAERRQVGERTSCLVAVPVAPSWGGGIEVEIAHHEEVPVVLLCEAAKLAARKISRLLRGNPAVIAEISYATEEDALRQLKPVLADLKLADLKSR